jgi:hypothetical protein
VRSLRLTAAVGLQGVLPLAAFTTVRDAHRPAAIAATVLVGQTAAVIAALLLLRGRISDQVVLRAVRIGVAASWILALFSAFFTAYTRPEFSALGPAVLVALAALAIAAGVFAADDPARDVILGAAAASSLLAAATFVPHLASAWRATSVEGLAVAGLAVLMLVPARVRRVPEIVVATAALGAGLSAIVPIMEALVLPFTSVRTLGRHPWAETSKAKATAELGTLDHSWTGTPKTGLLLLGVVAAAYLMGRHYSRALVAVVPVVAVSLLLVPLEAGMTLPVALAWDVAVGSSALLIAARRLASQRDLTGLYVGACGAVFLLVASFWSSLTPVLTVATLGAVLIATGVAAFVWPSVPDVWAPAFQVLVCLETAAVIHRMNPSVDPLWPALLAGGIACGLTTSLAHLGTKPEAGRTLILRYRLSPLPSAALLLASSWVRLAEAHVHSVEAYTLPSATVLLLAGYLRRRRDENAESWPCYGPGLTLGLVPTLIQATVDPGLLRPALVGVSALAVVLVGARQRLQAPLAVGAAVLAIDVVAQLSPFLASAYSAIPRWVLIAVVGAFLLALGATYERRIRDLRTLHQRFTALR